MPPTSTPPLSAPPPGQTVLYNVYHIYITQGTGPLHQGIALVPAQLQPQTAGRFYHVTGTVGLGMDYQCRPAEKFGLNPAFKSAVLMFQMPKPLLEEFEAIASSVPPPHDPRVLMERKPEPPARDCGTYTVKQGDWENGKACRMYTGRVIYGGTRVTVTNKPFNNRFLNLKGFTSNILHSEDIKKTGEVFWTDNCVTGPHPLASVGKRVCRVNKRGNDLFSDPDAVPDSRENSEFVQGIFATSIPQINRQSKIQDGISGAPIVRARKKSPSTPPDQIKGVEAV
ncbi:hypothetical protein V494_01105 [Pseudogymnoascus sp. VKM F-4513 (FW-928)]|nr:hypothetical protein V494_01105 [Pseudogymnoascus sp. VKM F-4513 (FW-928)]